MGARSETVGDAIGRHYPVLSGKLRDAADYVVQNPLDVASRSLRSVAAEAAVSPATFSRLARQIGFDSYEAMREASRTEIGQQTQAFSEKARRLQAENSDGVRHFFDRQAEACVANIDATSRLVSRERMDEAARTLGRARRVIVVGGRSSAGLADYFCYMGSWLSADWRRADVPSAGIGQALVDAGPKDVVFVIVKAPFTPRSLHAAESASAKGAIVMVVTDSHTCPALSHATHGFILPSESPQFFSSYASTVVFLEALIGMQVAQGGKPVQTRIRELEKQNRDLDRK